MQLGQSKVVEMDAVQSSFQARCTCTFLCPEISTPDTEKVCLANELSIDGWWSTFVGKFVARFSHIGTSGISTIVNREVLGANVMDDAQFFLLPSWQAPNEISWIGQHTCLVCYTLVVSIRHGRLVRSVRLRAGSQGGARAPAAPLDTPLGALVMWCNRWKYIEYPEIHPFNHHACMNQWPP